MIETEIVKIIESIQTEAQKRAKRETQRYGTLSPGDWHAQGDVSFERIEAIPTRAKPTKPTAQLAPGKSRGSRHIIKETDLPKVSFYKIPKANTLLGPVLDLSDSIEITHPDHGHVILPKGAYQIHYQRLFAPKIRRVTD